MKIFLWEEALQDWSYGVAMAIAPNVEEARSLLISEYKNHLIDYGSLEEDENEEDNYQLSEFKIDLSKNPKELSCDEIFWLFRKGGS